MSHTPVRFIDQLLSLERKLYLIPENLEPFDADVAGLIRQLDQKLGHAIHMINRNGPEREKARQAYEAIP
jgi:hypothetical protein